MTTEYIDLILCHQSADFDALGAAVGLTRLKPGGRVVLTGGANPAVKELLALYRDDLALIECRSVNPHQIRSLTVVDTQKRERLAQAAEWLDMPHLSAIEVYDHHRDASRDFPATYIQIESVGATTTLIVEQIQQKNVQLTTSEVTVMALGIHGDTGSLTFAQTTPRDAQALAWLMEQGASLPTIAEYTHPSLSPGLQTLLTEALEKLQTATVQGYTIAWVLLATENFVPGLAELATQLLKLTPSDALLLGNFYSRQSSGVGFTVIGRSLLDSIDLNQLFQPLGGGGHSQAASLTLRDANPHQTLDQLVSKLQAQIPPSLTAKELMSSPVRTIRPDTTIEQAQRVLLRYGHSGLAVVDEQDQLVGIISRRDIDLALHHSLSHAPVKGHMNRNLKTAAPDTTLPEMESLLVTYDMGRLPVLQEGQLVGIVTRTDVLQQRQGEQRSRGAEEETSQPISSAPLHRIPLESRISAPLWQFLSKAAEEAEKRGWHLYLVGGAVRDLLWADPSEDRETREQRGKQAHPSPRHLGTSAPPYLLTEPPLLQDIDLVVDGFHRSADEGAGVELAKALQENNSEARLEVHGAFQTAALLWHNHPELGSLWVDIATARTEFYPYPAANPEVEASSIRQDLYRRDFTINALALRLTRPQAGELLDFFGGLGDLRSRYIRVLHANSFIEDPTRIFRAVRFAVRLGFELKQQTEDYIRYAIESGVYHRSQNSKLPALQTRLKTELKYILQAPYWKPALEQLGELGALRCLHPTLELDKSLWWQVRLLQLWLRQFDPENTLTHWQMRLEVLIARLANSERGKVARNLGLPADSMKRLEQLEGAQADVSTSLPNCHSPSEVVKLLRQYKLPTLVLLGVTTPRKVRQKIWRYLSDWSRVQPPLNGNDLKALGYQPGPQYRQILDELLSARLDGVISKRAEAEGFLRQHYP